MRIASVILCVLPFTGYALVQAQENPREYAVNQTRPETGTRIVRPVATSVRIPLDKSYAELTAEQQRVLKSEYGQLPAADEPPFPVNGLQPIYRGIANAKPTAPADGELLVLVDVDAQGNATSTSVVHAPYQQVADLASKLLTREKYKPAVCSGHPCKMQFRFAVQLSAR